MRCKCGQVASELELLDNDAICDDCFAEYLSDLEDSGYVRGEDEDE